MFREIPSIDALETALAAHESQIARHRATQASLLAALAEAQVARVDRCRSTQEWVAGRLDVGQKPPPCSWRLPADSLTAVI